MIKDSDEFIFQQELNSVLNDDTHQIFNITTGMIHDSYDSRGYLKVYYYAIVIVEE